MRRNNTTEDGSIYALYLNGRRCYSTRATGPSAFQAVVLGLEGRESTYVYTLQVRPYDEDLLR